MYFSCLQTSDLESAQDDTFVASAQSPTQQNLLASLPRDEPIYVEGGFDVWLRDHRQTHFILRSKVTPALTDYQEKLKKQDEDDGELRFCFVIQKYVFWDNFIIITKWSYDGENI